MRSTTRGAGAAFAAAVAILLAASPARGASSPAGGFRSPAPGSRLDAGAFAEVSWDFPCEAGPGNEMELLLSLDGGTTFPIRVTRDLDVTTSAVSWNVPAFATSRARLALRRGESDAAETETIVFVSAEFAIRTDAGAAAEPLFPSASEWRTADALEGAERTPFSPGLDLGPAAPEHRIGRAARQQPAPPPRGASVENRLSLRAEPVPEPVRSAAASPIPLRGVRLSVPLRL